MTRLLAPWTRLGGMVVSWRLVIAQVEQVVPEGVLGDVVKTLPVLGFVLYVWYQTRQDVIQLRKENSDLIERMLAMQADSAERMLLQNTEMVPLLRECVVVLKEVSVEVAAWKRSATGGG